jgi:uncharacterized protein YacL
LGLPLPRPATACSGTSSTPAGFWPPGWWPDLVGFAVLPYLSVVPAGWLIRQVEALSTAEFVTAVAGLLLGLLMGLLLGLPVQLAPFGTWLPPRVDLPGPRDGGSDRGEAARPAARPRPSGSSVDLQRRAERTTRVTTDRGRTSAIIDGRMRRSSSLGCLRTLVIPRFVLDELQHIADSSDALRRNRGRRGLEILNRMQKEPATPVEIVEDDVPDVTEVDAKLVALARARSRVILTNDFNLNRVAELQGVRVMNINSLANAVKPAVLPGEEIRVRVIQEGKEAGQGVGSSTTAR